MGFFIITSKTHIYVDIFKSEKTHFLPYSNAQYVKFNPTIDFFETLLDTVFGGY